MDLRIINLHYALFFRDIVGRPDVEFRALNESMLNLFNGMPQIIPVPRELPPEIPVMTLSSENGAYSCSIARSRIDLKLQRIDDRKSNSEILKDFNAKVAAFSKYVLGQQEITRFGMVVQCFLFEESPIERLKEKYFTGKIPSVSELSLRFNEQSESEGFLINNVVDIGVQKIVVHGKECNGLMIQRDINNVVSEGREIDFQQLERLSRNHAGYISEKELEDLVK